VNSQQAAAQPLRGHTSSSIANSTVKIHVENCLEFGRLRNDEKNTCRLTAGHQSIGWQLVTGRLILIFLKFKAGIPS
jgi:hypothetical protein